MRAGTLQKVEGPDHIVDFLEAQDVLLERLTNMFGPSEAYGGTRPGRSGPSSDRCPSNQPADAFAYCVSYSSW